MLPLLIGIGALSGLGYMLYQYGLLATALEIIGEVLSEIDFSLD